MMNDNNFFYNLTRKKLSCSKNLVELTTYNDITLWWFVDSNFHRYVDNLKIGGLNGRSSRLKIRLIFFYKKIDIFLDLLIMVKLGMIL